jgi:hypothetical protein
MAHLVSFIDTQLLDDPQPLNPLNAPQPLEQPEHPEPLKSITTAHKSALLVAKHPSLLKFLRRFFEEEEEYTIRTASNSEEGMRLYGDFGPFNVVLIDYDVPQRNGSRSTVACRKQVGGVLH